MPTALNTLLDHAERQRDALLGEIARIEAQLRHLQAQRQQLLAYRDDYRQRGPAQGGRSASIEMLRCHQAFMLRLQQAVDQQQQQLQGAEELLARLRDALLPLEQRVASVAKLMGRRGEASRLASERREQRQADDASQQRAQRPNPNAMPGAL
jgi:flagellar FliJ protein